MPKKIKVIDLFAGPGGLSEGFSSLKNKYKIAISIEKDKSAHKTLLLRSFIRQFKSPPAEYYKFLKGELGDKPEDILFKIPKYKKKYEAAKKEARCLTLGKDNNKIRKAIDEVIGLDDCIIIGGPPCQAYSLAGRAKNANTESYSAESDHRNFLYIEYMKQIARYQPKIFVMENVKGMLSARINNKSIFRQILEDLESPNTATNSRPQKGREKFKYKIFSFSNIPSQTDLFGKAELLPNDFIIKSELYDIPQSRHRVILFGVREDLVKNWNENCILEKNNKISISVKDVISDLPKLRSGLSKEENSDINWFNNLNSQVLKLISELSKDKSTKEFSEFMNGKRQDIKSFEKAMGANIGSTKRKNLNLRNADLKDWFTDKAMDNLVINHQSRGHIKEDILRYFFVSSWAQFNNKKNKINSSPKSSDFPASLKPNHKNFDSGKFVDRFRVQIESRPANTVTSHISKDGHHFIHYDPLQARSLTVREAARVQTFPDNYFFVGTRTEQYVQVGNAVPPYLAKKLAELCSKVLK